MTPKTRLASMATPSIAATLFLTGLAGFGISLTSCGAALPGSKAKNVDPSSCGSYASSDAGRKVKAFLEATVELNEAVIKADNYLLDTCKEMGAELGVPPEGDAKTVCNAVAVALQNHLEIAIKPEAKVELEFVPASCEVDMGIAAKAAASCGSESASCKAKALVSANVRAKCNPPEVKFNADASIIVDTSKVEAAKRAIDIGLGRILSIQRRATKPMRTAFAGWVQASSEMTKALSNAANEFGKQSLCVAGQLRAALDLQAKLKASISIQIDVSASVRASAGAGRGEKDAQ